MHHSSNHTAVMSIVLLCISNKLNFDLHVPTHSISELFQFALYLLLFLVGVGNINAESLCMNLDSADSNQVS